MLFLNPQNNLEFKYDLNTWENYKFSFDVIPAFKFMLEFTRHKYFVIDLEIFKDCTYGIGDVIMMSSIPEAIKKDPKKLYEKVYIRKYGKTKYSDYDLTFLETVFRDNPYVDGFIDYPTTYIYEGINIPHANSFNYVFPELNVTNLMLYYIGVDQSQGNTYTPKFYFNTPIQEEYIDSVVIDLNANSTQRNYHKEKVTTKVEDYFETQGIIPDYEIVFGDKNVSSLNQIFKLDKVEKLVVNNLEDYIKVVNSCKEFYCLFSGSSLIATALGKKNFNIFFVEEQFTNKYANMAYNKFRIKDYGKEIRF